MSSVHLTLQLKQVDVLVRSDGFEHILSDVNESHTETAACPYCNAQLTLDVTPSKELTSKERSQMISTKWRNAAGRLGISLVIILVAWIITISSDFSGQVNYWICVSIIITAVLPIWVWLNFSNPKNQSILTQNRTPPSVKIISSTSDMSLHYIEEAFQFVVEEPVMPESSGTVEFGCLKDVKDTGFNLFSDKAGEAHYNISHLIFKKGGVAMMRIEKRRCPICGKDVYFEIGWRSIDKDREQHIRILNNETVIGPGRNVISKHQIIYGYDASGKWLYEKF